MQAAQTSCISSTYWREAIGPTAALATIAKMRTVNLPDYLDRIGRAVQDGWKTLAAKHELDLTVSGLPALCHFALNYGRQSQPLRTLLTQCMLDRGFLATNVFYPTYAHNEGIVDEYLSNLDETFVILREAVAKSDVMSRLRGPVAHEGFSRLT